MVDYGYVTRAQLTDAIQEGRLDFDRLLNRFDADEMREAVLSNGWTVADVIAHIVVWDQRLLGWLAETAHGDDPSIPAPGYSWDDIDQLNEENRIAQQGRPIGEIMADYRASLSLIFHALEQFDDETLNSQYFPTESEPLWKFFAANTYDHYAEHTDDIIAWLEAHNR
jgi:hypothetical protein